LDCVPIVQETSDGVIDTSNSGIGDDGVARFLQVVTEENRTTTLHENALLVNIPLDIDVWKKRI
jgi:hypothetical protein